MNWLPLDAAFADGRPVLLLVGAFYDHATHVLDMELEEEPSPSAFACTRIDVDAHPALAARLAPGLPRIVIVEPGGKLLSDRLRPTRADLTTLSTPIVVEPQHFTSFGDWPCDFRLGGFGRPPKSPHAPALQLLLDHPELPWAQPFVERTLNALVQGGLHDHLGGGFHRASADDAWVLPQFGKRAADQAALIPLLLRAGKPHFVEAAERAACWVMEFLAAPEGGYHNAEDADSGPFDDGSFHTWSMEEARAVLSDEEFRAAQPWLDLYGRGELHSDPTRNVLFIANSLSRIAKETRIPEADLPPLLEAARHKLAAAQRRRPRPPIDPAIYVAPSARLAEALLAFPDSRAHALLTIERLSPTRDWLEDHVALGVAALAADRRPLAQQCLERMEPFRKGDLYLDTTRDTWLGPPRAPFLDGAGESACALTVRLLAGLGHHQRARELSSALVAQATAAGPTGAGLLRNWT